MAACRASKAVFIFNDLIAARYKAVEQNRFRLSCIPERTGNSSDAPLDIRSAPSGRYNGTIVCSDLAVYTLAGSDFLASLHDRCGIHISDLVPL